MPGVKSFYKLYFTICHSTETNTSSETTITCKTTVLWFYRWLCSCSKRACSSRFISLQLPVKCVCFFSLPQTSPPHGRDVRWVRLIPILTAAMYINVSELLKSYTFLHTLSLRSSAHRPPCMCYYSRFWPQASESIVLKFDWFTALTSIQGCTLYFFSFFSRKTNYSTPQHYIYIYIHTIHLIHIPRESGRTPFGRHSSDTLIGTPVSLLIHAIIQSANHGARRNVYNRSSNLYILCITY